MSYSPSSGRIYSSPAFPPHARRRSLPLLHGSGSDQWTDFDSNSASSPTNSSRRPSADLADSLYTFQTRKRSYDLSVAEHVAEAFRDPKPPSSPQLRPVTRLTPASTGRTSTSAGRASPSSSGHSGSGSGGSHRRDASGRPATRLRQETFEEPPARPMMLEPSFASYRLGASPSSAAMARRSPSPMEGMDPASRSASPRGRRPLAPGEHKYPQATTRERLRQQKSLENLRRLPSVGVQRPGSADSQKTKSTPATAVPNLPRGRWTVPKLETPPPGPIVPMTKKERRQAEFEELLRRKVLMQTASGRRKLMELGGPDAFIDPLEQVLGPADPMETKAFRGGYSGLGVEKGEGWKNHPEFRKLLDEHRAAGDMSTRARSSSIYLGEPDDMISPLSLDPSSARAGSAPPLQRTSPSRSKFDGAVRPPLPKQPASVPFSLSQSAGRSGGARAFARRPSVHGLPGIMSSSRRPPPLDLGHPHRAGHSASAPVLTRSAATATAARHRQLPDETEAVVAYGYHAAYPLTADPTANGGGFEHKSRRKMTIKGLFKAI